MNQKSKLIVPLDVDNLEAARQLMDMLRGVVGMFKVGHQLFTSVGPRVVEMVHQHGESVFLDLKFHDIPNTVAGAVAAATRPGVRMLNVHASGGQAMMAAAVHSAQEHARCSGIPRPLLLGVTVLTSIAEEELQQTLGSSRALSEQVVYLAQQAQQAGLDGVVASPHEIRSIREACGENFVIVTPGVRPAGSGSQDQKRVMTPAQAVAAGADYLVIGRPIRNAPDPRLAAERILEEMTLGDTRELKADG